MALGDFTEQAESYRKSRPGYPSRLVEALVAGAEVRPGDAVCEIGAGTGVFTALLAGRGFRVTAVEPNQAMRERAPRWPDVDWRDGTFEATGRAASSCRWVVAAQAFHWADPPRALKEIRRVLLPGGRFTVLWNCREYERSELLEATRRMVLRHVPEFTAVYRDIDWEPVLLSTGDFDSPAYLEESHVVPMSRERYLEVWKSHHRLNHVAGPERFARFFEELRHLLHAPGEGGRPVRDPALDVPYLCRAWTVSRREDVS